MKKKAVILQISGRVQGVGFRFFTQQKAKELGVTGYVQNCPDGSVLVEAEADEESLIAFVLICQKGPAWARVINFKLTDTLPIGYIWFEIK